MTREEFIEKLKSKSTSPIVLRRKIEQTALQSNITAATIDYNIMMGNLEDPSEEEEE